MAKDLTIGDLKRKLNRGDCTLQLSYSSGCYHAYVHRNDVLVGYDRGDIDQAIEGAFKKALPKEPIGLVPEIEPANGYSVEQILMLTPEQMSVLDIHAATKWLLRTSPIGSASNLHGMAEFAYQKCIREGERRVQERFRKNAG